MNKKRLSRLRSHLLQVAAAFAVGAGGFASLGTTDCTQDYAIRAVQSVEFTAADQEQWVRVRVSPKGFREFAVAAGADVVIEQIDPPPPSTGGTPPIDELTGGTGFGGSPSLTTGGASSAGTSSAGASFAGTSSAGTSSAGGAPGSGGAPRFDGSGGSPPPGNQLIITRQPEGATEFLLRVDRGDELGAFTTRITVSLTVEACPPGPEHMDLRVDVVPAPARDP